MQYLIQAATMWIDQPFTQGKGLLTILHRILQMWSLQQLLQALTPNIMGIGPLNEETQQHTMLTGSTGATAGLS